MNVRFDIFQLSSNIDHHHSIMSSLKILKLRQCAVPFLNQKAFHQWKCVAPQILYRTLISVHSRKYAFKIVFSQSMVACPGTGCHTLSQAVRLRSSVHAPQIQYMIVSSHEKQFTVGFTDEGPKDGPILLALHGVPGGSMDFSPLFEPLLDAGIRIITINFPGNG